MPVLRCSPGPRNGHLQPVRFQPRHGKAHDEGKTKRSVRLRALLVLITFDFLGRNNSTLKFGSLLFTFAYIIAVSLLVLRSAKDDGLVHALLIVLFPPYALFYVCAVNHDKSLIVLWLSGWVAIFALFLINPHWN